MAYIVRVTEDPQATAAGTFTVPYTATAGNLLILACRYLSVTNMAVPSGWTALIQAGSGRNVQVFYRTAAGPGSVSVTLPTLGGISIVEIAGHTGVPIGGFTSQVSSLTRLEPAPTVASADSLFLWGTTEAGYTLLWPRMEIAQAVSKASTASGVTHPLFASTVSPGYLGGATFGASGSGTAQAYTSWWMIVQTAVGAPKGPYPTGGMDTLIQFNGGNSTPILVDPTTVVGSTLLGVPVTNVVPTRTAVGALGSAVWFEHGYTQYQFSVGAAAPQWHCPLASFPSTDFTGKLWSIEWALGSRGNVNLNDPVLALFVSSGGWKAVSLGGMPADVVSFAQRVVVDVQNAPAIASGGTFNPAAVTAAGIMVSRAPTVATVISMSVRGMVLLSPQVYAGSPIGSTTWTWALGAANLLMWGLRGIHLLQGQSQVLARCGIKVGLAGTITQLAATASSLEFQNNSGLYQLGSGRPGIEVNAQSGDTIVFDAGQMSSSTGHVFQVSGPTTELGAAIIGMAPTFTSPVSGATFSGCSTVTAGSVSSSVFSGGTGSVSLALTAAGPLQACTFVRGSEAYAVRISVPGNYSLVGTSFSGYPTDIEVTATSGTVTLQLVLGQTAPTYTTAGATVVIVLPQATGTVSGFTVGSRVRVYNVTAATEVYNGIPGTGSVSWNYDDGTTFTSGDTIEVRVTYQSGATAKLPFRGTAVATGAGWAVGVAQEDDGVYATNAIDGSTVTELVADYPNLHIDSNDVDGTTQVQRIYAWAVWAQTTVTGIRDFFNCILAEDESNYRVRTAVVNLRLDNVISTPLMVTGGRLYRDDGLTVIAPTSNSIQLDPGKAYPVEVGTSGLTAGESALLGQISSLALESTASAARDNAALAAALSA